MIFDSSSDATILDMIRGFTHSANDAEVSPALHQPGAQAAQGSPVHREAFNAPVLLISEHDVPTQDELFDLVFSQENEHHGLPASAASSTVELGKLPDPSSYRLTTKEGRKAYKKDRGITTIEGDNDYRRARQRQLKEADPSVRKKRRDFQKQWSIKKGFGVKDNPLSETKDLPPTAKGVRVHRHQFDSQSKYVVAYISDRRNVDPDFRELLNSRALARYHRLKEISGRSGPASDGSPDGTLHQLDAPAGASTSAPLASLKHKGSSTQLSTGKSHEVDPSGSNTQPEKRQKSTHLADVQPSSGSGASDPV